MKLKYKAILYETREEVEYLYLSKLKQEELNKVRPIDSTLLDKKCYSSADKYFHTKMGWPRTDSLHIEIEDEPRVVEA